MMSGSANRIADALVIAMITVARGSDMMRTAITTWKQVDELVALASVIDSVDNLLEQLTIACISQAYEHQKLNARIEADRAKAAIYTPPWKDEQGNSKPLLGGKVRHNEVLPRVTVRMLKPTREHKFTLTTHDCKELFGVDFTVKELPDTLHCVFCYSPVEIANSSLGRYMEGKFSINRKPNIIHRKVNGKWTAVKSLNLSGGKQAKISAPIIKTGRACNACKGNLVEILPEADYRKKLPDDPGFADNLSVIKHPLDDSDQLVANGSLGVNREATFASSLGVSKDWMTSKHTFAEVDNEPAEKEETRLFILIWPDGKVVTYDSLSDATPSGTYASWAEFYAKAKANGLASRKRFEVRRLPKEGVR